MMDQELKQELAQLKTDSILIKYTVEQIETKLDQLLQLLVEMQAAQPMPVDDSRITRL